MTYLYTIPIDEPEVTLAEVGGKGASLARLAAAGLPVPGGFHVTTRAYQMFVAQNELQPLIIDALQTADLSQPAALEAASAAIQARFAHATMPVEVLQAISQAYAALPGDHPVVAIRSSATAEDLPGMSFAGQQESFLNIHGLEKVLAAVQRCWASLWTARAIGYRAQHGIDQNTVHLAVVVQFLVPAQVSGILFTADPVTGRRDQAVITASWGLGEAIVSGLVTPDTFRVDKANGQTRNREISPKTVMTVLMESGTAEQKVPKRLHTTPALSEPQIAELVRLGVRIETLYGMPMDIEWALADGEFFIVQARPITALPEPTAEATLEWRRPHPKGVYMRTSVVDLMPDPLSPLFATLGIPALVEQMYPLGKHLTRMQPVLPDGYFTVINQYAYMNAHFSGRAWVWILFGMLPSYPRMLRMLIPFWRDEARPRYRGAVAVYQHRDLEQMSAAELWLGVQAIMNAAGYYTGALMFATMGASAGSEALLTKIYDKFARRPGDPPATALLMGWDNQPSRAEKSLFDLVGFCREHPALEDYLLKTPSSALVGELAGGRTPQGVAPGDWEAFRRRFEAHLDTFGHMIFELDFAKPLPRDHPGPMLEAVKMYLRGEGANPYERQKSSQERRIATAEAALGRVRGIKRWAFSKALRWAQSLSEVREDALADIGLGYPLLRRMLQILGERFRQAGVLVKAEDIFWLEKDELERTVAGLESRAALNSLHARVEQRKAFWNQVRQITPPPMIPYRKKYLGFNTDVWLAETEANRAGKVMKGVPASPGRVTAPARVLHGPEEFDQMRPGEILVAGTTTPAWTPLFAMASAVVTDIGGPLSHGSIVAREYGIPAVMGTGVATRRISSGQIVTVDGSAGLVTLSDAVPGNGRQAQ